MQDKSPEVLIDQVRRIAMALPGVTEKLSHGEPAFFARGKMFITADTNHHGSGHIAIWCKAAPGAQQALVQAEPRHFFVPPYVGTRGWVGVRLDSGIDAQALAELIEDAWAGTRRQASREGALMACDAKTGHESSVKIFAP